MLMYIICSEHVGISSKSIRNKYFQILIESHMQTQAGMSECILLANKTLQIILPLVVYLIIQLQLVNLEPTRV